MKAKIMQYPDDCISSPSAKQLSNNDFMCNTCKDQFKVARLISLPSCFNISPHKINLKGKSFTVDEEKEGQQV